MSGIGIVCMAFGAKARAEAQTLVGALERSGNHYPVVVVGDESVPGAVFRRWDGEDPFEEDSLRNYRFRAGRVKPHLHEYVDFDRCLYLDTDCKPLRSLAPGFDLLESFDFAVAEHPGQLCNALYNKPNAGWYHNRREAAATIAEWGTGAVPYWNSGVLFFRRCDATVRLFHAWDKQWRRFGQWDEQLALMRAAYRNPLRVCVLPVGWNAPHSSQAEVIFHWYGRGTSRDTGDG